MVGFAYKINLSRLHSLVSNFLTLSNNRRLSRLSALMFVLTKLKSKLINLCLLSQTLFTLYSYCGGKEWLHMSWNNIAS